MLFSIIYILIVALIATSTVDANRLSPLIKGRPEGFAVDAIGGGDVSPSHPKNIGELEALLQDSQPRVIVIDKLFNFIGSQGRTREMGCRTERNTCPGRGQDALNGPDWCKDKPQKVELEYDVAGVKGILVKGKKTIVGVGPNAEIRGRGVRITGTDIIIQNIRIAEINPHVIWGGDALDVIESDNLWIDHVTVARVGRQFLVTGYKPAGRVTISNCEFDGRTEWSHTCNGKHYWVALLLGSDDKISFLNNYIHDISGRAPKVGGSDTAKVVLHAINNVFLHIDGHAFEVDQGGTALLDGNYFSDVRKPVERRSTGTLVAIDDNSTEKCKELGVGRPCAANQMVDSGPLVPTKKGSDALASGQTLFESYPAPVVEGPNLMHEAVIAKAGAGKFESSPAPVVEGPNRMHDAVIAKPGAGKC